MPKDFFEPGKPALDLMDATLGRIAVITGMDRNPAYREYVDAATARTFQRVKDAGRGVFGPHVRRESSVPKPPEAWTELYYRDAKRGLSFQEIKSTYPKGKGLAELGSEIRGDVLPYFDLPHLPEGNPEISWRLLRRTPVITGQGPKRMWGLVAVDVERTFRQTGLKNSSIDMANAISREAQWALGIAQQLKATPQGGYDISDRQLRDQLMGIGVQLNGHGQTDDQVLLGSAIQYVLTMAQKAYDPNNRLQIPIRVRPAGAEDRNDTQIRTATLIREELAKISLGQNPQSMEKIVTAYNAPCIEQFGVGAADVISMELILEPDRRTSSRILPSLYPTVEVPGAVNLIGPLHLTDLTPDGELQGKGMVPTLINPPDATLFYDPLGSGVMRVVNMGPLLAIEDKRFKTVASLPSPDANTATPAFMMAGNGVRRFIDI